MTKLALYIHFPFCLSKCSYCDFISFQKSAEEKNKYIDVLVDEINFRAKKISSKNYIVDSIFFGGGTPTCLTVKNLIKVENAIYKNFLISENLEYTIEANPETLSFEYLSELRETKINRLSIGVQSFNIRLLKSIERIHDVETVLNAFKNARKLSYNNINLDFIYSLADEKIEDIENNIEYIKNLKPEHLSFYDLIISPESRIYEKYQKGILKEKSDDYFIEANNLIRNSLEKIAYHQYEISNYSKKGFECKHNIKYWQLKDYLGLGLASHSYINKERYNNTEVFDDYLNNDFEKYNLSKISLSEEASDYIIFALRMNKGINFDYYQKRFNIDFKEKHKKVIAKLVKNDLLILSNCSVFLTVKGQMLSNQVILQFI